MPLYILYRKMNIRDGSPKHVEFINIVCENPLELKKIFSYCYFLD